jgi:hypothetical protein
MSTGLADVSREGLEGDETIKRQGKASNSQQPRSLRNMFRDTGVKVFSCPLHEGI